MEKTRIDLNLESVQVREQRLGAITSWSGESAAKLVNLAECGGLKD